MVLVSYVLKVLLWSWVLRAVILVLGIFGIFWTGMGLLGISWVVVMVMVMFTVILVMGIFRISCVGMSLLGISCVVGCESVTRFVLWIKVIWKLWGVAVLETFKLTIRRLSRELHIYLCNFWISYVLLHLVICFCLFHKALAVQDTPYDVYYLTCVQKKTFCMIGVNLTRLKEVWIK